MKTRYALIPVLALAGALITAATNSPSSPTTPSTSKTASIHSRALGCDITFKAENKTLKNIHVVLEQSEVRTKQIVAGPWSRMDRKCPIDSWRIPEQAGVKSTTCELDMMCDLKRQYKFRIEERSENGNNVLNSAWVYFPSDDGWADAGTRTINLGNVGRHFN